MNMFDEEKVSEKIVSSYIRVLKARKMHLHQENLTERMEGESAATQLLEGRYSLKNVNLTRLNYDIKSAMENEIYSLAKEKWIEIAEDKNQWSLTDLDEIRKKICPELVKRLPTIVDRIEIKDKKLVDLKKF